MEFVNLRFFVLICFCLLSFIPMANAKSLLIDNENIWDELLQVSVANKISEECTSIDARKIKGLFALLQIKSVAKELGYTDNEINEFVSSEENKKKLKK